MISLNDCTLLRHLVSVKNTPGKTNLKISRMCVIWKWSCSLICSCNIYVYIYIYYICIYIYVSLDLFFQLFPTFFNHDIQEWLNHNIQEWIARYIVVRFDMVQCWSISDWYWILFHKDNTGFVIFQLIMTPYNFYHLLHFEYRNI